MNDKKPEPQKRPEYDPEKIGAMGLYHLFYNAQEQQYVENLKSSQGRWTVVGGFKRYDLRSPEIVTEFGLFVKREFESAPSMYVVNDSVVDCLDSFLETMKGVNRFELFTGEQEIVDLEEKSRVVYGILSAAETKVLYDILTRK